MLKTHLNDSGLEHGLCAARGTPPPALETDSKSDSCEEALVHSPPSSSSLGRSSSPSFASLLVLRKQDPRQVARAHDFNLSNVVVVSDVAPLAVTPDPALDGVDDVKRASATAVPTCSGASSPIPDVVMTPAFEDNGEEAGNVEHTPSTSPLPASSSPAVWRPGDRCVINQHDAHAVACEVLAAEDGKCYVHYLKFDARWDEWVDVRHLCKVDPRDYAHWFPEEISHHHHHHSHSHSKRARDHPALMDPHGGVNGEDGGGGGAKIWRHAAGHHDEHTKIRNVQQVQLGPYLMDAWYYSPYPIDHRVDVLFVCERTFKYATSSGAFRNHVAPTSYPGVVVYRDARFVVHRIEGVQHRLFCQNLSLLGKLFIEHKTLHYDPTPFDFFLILETDSLRPVGYFSKEKVSSLGYNLACIVTFPPHQRKGVGKFIISLSYELSKREGKTGSPEKPLSDLGKRSYRSYWSCRLLMLLRDACESGARPTVQSLSAETGIRVEDVMSTLQFLGFIKHLRGTFVLAVSLEKVQAHLAPFAQRSFALGFCDASKVLADEPQTQRSAS